MMKLDDDGFFTTDYDRICSKATVRKADRIANNLYKLKPLVAEERHYQRAAIHIEAPASIAQRYVVELFSPHISNNKSGLAFLHEISRRLIDLDGVKDIAIVSVTHRLIDKTYEVEYRYTETNGDVIEACLPLLLIIHY